MKDITQKDFFTKDERFADYINAVFFHGKQIVKAGELISVPEGVRKADELAILERTCDVVKKQTKEGTVFAIYVMENQEKVDYRMPARIMLEESLIYDSQIKKIATDNTKTFKHASGHNLSKENEENVTDKRENIAFTEDEYVCRYRKTDYLTPVYTSVLYWGDKEWDGARSLREMVNVPIADEIIRAEMLELVPDYKIKIFDLNKENDFKAFGKTLKTVFEFYAAGKDKKLFQNYMDEHGEEVEALDKESKFFLATMLGKKHLAKEFSKMNQKEGNSMCKAIDDLIVDKANEMLMQHLKEMEEKGEGNCKAIDVLIADRAKELSEEYEVIIAGLHKELEEQKAQSMLEIEQLKAQLAALA